MDICEEIKKVLEENIDKEYSDFQTKLTPSISKSSILGVRTPILKSLAKEYSKRSDITIFLNSLPHKYFEENQLHSFIISLDKDYDNAIKDIDKFLEFVDNWATCDQLSPVCFKKNKDKLILKIDEWLESEHVYKVRFGILMLMKYYLDESFDIGYAYKVAKLKSNEYYINMMVSWYMATALAKKYDKIISILEEKQMDSWIHNKTIQKAIESSRISVERKDYLKSLKIKKL